MRFLALFCLLSLLTTSAVAQALKADFTLPNQACIGENIFLENSSVNAKSYAWDFCEGDLQMVPVASTYIENSLNIPAGACLINTKGQWYGFIVSLINNSIFRIDFGASLQNSSVKITDLGNMGGGVDQPQDIKAIEFNDQYYLFVNNRGNNKLIRINLGSNIEVSTATSDVIVSGKGYVNGGLDIAFDGTNWVAFLTSATSLTRVSIGNSISNVPSLTDVQDLSTIPNISGIGDIKLVNENSQWYGFLIGFSSRTVHRLTFGTSLLQSPTATRLNIPSIGGTPYGLTVEQDNNQWNLFASTNDGDLLRMNIGEDITNDSPVYANLGNLGALNRILKFDMAQDKSHWLALATDWDSKKYFLLRFPQVECPFTQSYSTNTDTVQITAPESGIFTVSLVSKGVNGLTSKISKTIKINNTEAPAIKIESDVFNNVCFQGIQKQFTVQTDRILISTDWTINSEARTGEAVTYTFPAPGTYEVTLEVESENGCGNRLAKEITIYEPPDPNFSLPAGQICTNGSVSFTNTTDTKGADSLITYQWLVDGELVSEEANPDITFTEGGSKTLQLAASIPGCTETFEQTIDVIQGPSVDFALPPQLCEGEIITLENQTTGDNITGYAWSFGDGGALETATADPVSYTFTEAGTYDISLTANSTLGCANVATQTVTVYEQPRVGFTSDVACVGAVTQFADTSSAGGNANIIAWNWDFGDGVGTDDVRNPTYTFSAPGTYTVELTTQSSGGCTASATQTVTVETSVTADFTGNRVCPTETDPFLYQFEDNSTVAEGETITQRLWTINGENFVDESLTYVFDEPGTYEVSLTAFASSGCNATSSQSLTVAALPEVRFQAATNCVGEPIVLSNLTEINGWELAQYTWDIPTIGAVFENSPTVVFSEAGEYPITLTVETTGGAAEGVAGACTFSWDSTLVILESPVAAFELPQLSGGSPFALAPTNLSSGNTRSLWTIDGSVVSEETTPQLTLNELGTYELALIALNDIGCSDTTRATVEVVEPTVDLVVENLSSVPDGSSQQWVLTIQNTGSLAVNEAEVLINLGDVISVKEQISELILPGERLAYPLQTSLGDVRNQQNPVEYICARVIPVVETGTSGESIIEVNAGDNRVCITLTAPVLVEAPFPNPTSKEAVLSVLLEEPGMIQVNMISATGELVLSQQIAQGQSGLNTMVLEVSQAPPGVYSLEVTALGRTLTRRIIVSP